MILLLVQLELDLIVFGRFFIKVNPKLPIRLSQFMKQNHNLMGNQ